MVRILACGSLLAVLAGLGGCGTGTDSLSAAKTATPAVKATGAVYGGQQPVTGATIQLWTAGTTGFGSAGTQLLGATVTTSDGTGTTDTNANAGNDDNTLPAGSFTLNFANAYTCPVSNPLVYMTATGGNPGLSGTVNNTALVMLAALGPCNSLNSTTYIVLNEVTTVGTVESLAAFLSTSGSIGSPSDSASLQAITNAFAAVNTLVSISTGNAQSGFPKLSTIANALVPCVNSVGPPSSSDCSTLFGYTTPSGGTEPSTILEAILDIALNPTLNTTPIFDISIANAPFQPALSAAPAVWNITTTSSAKSACGFANGGDTVSGSVTYSGSHTGRVYLALNNTSGCEIGTEGTSISITAPGTYPYTIHSVPPATYTLEAFMDTQGYGAINAANPTGSASYTVNNTSFTGANVTLTDPSTVTLSTAPTITGASGTNTGAVLQYKPINSNGVETATSYTLQWSTSSAFSNSSTTYSQTFPATGTDINVWFLNAAAHPELTNGSIFYFRAYGTSAGTAQGPSSTIYGPVTIGLPSTGSTVSGDITFTGTATGPMYAGLYNQNNDTHPVYLQYIQDPFSAQGYSLSVPTSTSAVYIPVVEIDQNNDGVIDWGDLTNVTFQEGPIAVPGTVSNQNVTLASGNAIAIVATQAYLSGSTTTYGLYFDVGWAAKLPVAVTLLNSYNTDGANIDDGPLDIASCAVGNTNCNQGSANFQIYFSLGSTAPSVGDTYLFNLTYSDGTTATMVAEVSNVITTFPTNLLPQTGTSTSTTPNFSWTDPTCGACSTYTYQFNLSSSSGNIWSVPDNSNGLPPGTDSLTWDDDPTDSNNTVSPLSTGTTYSWSVTVQDGSYNSATTTVSYEP